MRPFFQDDDFVFERASASKISQLPESSYHFLKYLRGWEPEMTFISDKSSLSDFFYLEEDEMINHIFLLYAVDVSDIEDGHLAKIFQRIRDEGVIPSKQSLGR